MTTHFSNQVQNEMACLNNSIASENFNPSLLPILLSLFIKMTTFFIQVAVSNYFVLRNFSLINCVSIQQCNQSHNTSLGSSMIVWLLFHSYCPFIP